MLVILYLQVSPLPQNEMWALAFLLLFVVQCGWAAQCNAIKGPPGPTECIQIAQYNKHDKRTIIYLSAHPDEEPWYLADC